MHSATPTARDVVDHPRRDIILEWKALTLTHYEAETPATRERTSRLFKILRTPQGDWVATHYPPVDLDTPLDEVLSPARGICKEANHLSTAKDWCIGQCDEIDEGLF
jgi:hypothetical protein